MQIRGPDSDNSFVIERNPQSPPSHPYLRQWLVGVLVFASIAGAVGFVCLLARLGVIVVVY
jgi:hypothetical protein